VVGLTRALALEFAPLGISINAVAPGAVVTPLTAHTYTPEVRRSYEQRIAVGRVSTPRDIVGAIVFLASDAARYMVGQELLVDGGLALNGNVSIQEN
jgi:NAD(P)-dependent dehydrogenase (short-subunit alcohol dehydrogenase family)